MTIATHSPEYLAGQAYARNDLPWLKSRATIVASLEAARQASKTATSSSVADHHEGYASVLAQRLAAMDAAS